MMVTNLKRAGVGSLDLRDVIFLLCAVGALYGVWQLSVPLAWVCGGALGAYLTYASAPAPEEPAPEPPAQPEGQRPR
jgi:hypothetical protein